ncbi:MAG TPA: invasion associated locus B family protein [Hyphomicrobiaceae bacterium]|nr:invasion associated locus B family protein [Hyphomicrobiaceae bacterium]
MNGKASILASVARSLGGITLALAMAGTSAAVAQQKKGEAKAAPAPAAQAKAAEQVMWVKLCEKAPVMTKDKEGKDVKAEKGICLTHHERLDGNTGMVLVSAAVRQVEGADKQHLMIMVPLGMAIQPGLRATVYDKELWAKAQKNEKVDDAKLSPIKLNFSLCHPAGCTAEIELTKELVDQLRNNAGLMVFSINASGQVIAFPVPLAGFGAALDGAPVDNEKYTTERRRLMKEIADRQEAAFAEYKKKELEAAAAAQRGEAPAPAAAPAKGEKKK